MPTELRDGYLETLAHVEAAYGKIAALVGRGRPLTFPDVHKLSEGLFLSTWTYWEGFLCDLLWTDLASDPRGLVLADVSKFRSRNSAWRIADLVLTHPDHPEKFVDWSDYRQVVKRANFFLAAGHRFTDPLVQADDIVKIKRLRNAIAHRSDKAWKSFLSLVTDAPFNFTPAQRRGLTPGRFLYAHQWNGASVMQHSIATLRGAANALVP